jgi:hypothetical protein
MRMSLSCRRQLTLNQRVQGSSPCAPTKLAKLHAVKAIAELVRSVQAQIGVFASVGIARKTRAVGVQAENLRRAATDWWSNEDSNQGPGRFYRRRATGFFAFRERDPKNT